MLRPTLLLNCVRFMNSRWSPVFWCNNGSTSLSHPPPPFSLRCFISVSVLWIPAWSPVFYYSNDTTLLSALHFYPSLLRICVSLIKVPYFDATMAQLRSHHPPPPLRLYDTYIVSVSALWIPAWSSVFNFSNDTTSLSHTPPPFLP